MKLLLDTHILIWYLNGDNNLNPKKILILEDRSNQLFVSIATLWEIAIKINVNKLEYSQDFNLIPQNLEKYQIEVLEISFQQLQLYKDLPLHHKDPFDRLLITQALSEQLTIITEDKAFEQYTAALI